MLIRLLAVHRAYQIPPDEQAGKPDGFFKFQNFAVIYDCTLATDFEERKRQQIQNYCNQVLHGPVKIPPNIEEHVGNHQKQVWIVTRGRSRVIQNVGDIGNVRVKEIAVTDLKQLYLERLLNPLNEDDLEKRLGNLGKK